MYDSKLRAEGWFDAEKTRKVDARVYEALIANMGMEVSTGVQIQCANEEGEFQGKSYTRKAQLLTPDHLAVLPDKIGAYSMADGAGLFQMNHKEVDPRKIESYLDELKGKILANCGKVVGNEMAASSIQGLLNAALQTKYTGFDGYVDELFQSFFIFYSYSPGVRGLYKMNYTHSDTVGVSLVGEPTLVFKTLVYRAVEGGAFVGNSTTAPIHKEKEMPKKETIDRLISNGDFVETDRPSLEAFADTRLDDMLNKSNQRVEVANRAKDPAPVVPPVTAPVTPPVTNANPAPQQASLEQLLATASPEHRELIQNGLNVLRQQKTDLIAVILANNTRGNFNQAWLESQTVEVLTPIARAVAPVQPTVTANNFMGAAGSAGYLPPVTAHNEQPLTRPSAVFGADAKA